MTEYNRHAPNYSLGGRTVKALVISVYDGDTFRCVFGMPEVFDGKQFSWSVRVVGIDTPELRGSGPYEKQLALEARDRLRELILDQEIDVEIQGQDKYGRLLGVPWVNGDDAGMKLVVEEMAVLYTGVGPKEDWEVRGTKRYTPARK
jgi:endonuclease YncB( thermonuclease family)